MVQRSKRSMPRSKVEEMKAVLKPFHSEVRRWCGEIPIGSTVYVALESLNSALLLTDRQFNAEIDGRTQGKGDNGLHDFE
ncbi:hypothetical protein [Bosea lathyri]|uniref:Uncharacterized protein n=1 Tax=Bosea lathyri TaxID=1036778 RepID=A0A1H6BKN4_9HYPH|nr:hypothetical protein [Bosea lathyri]SEG61025.1 hypothetical protein SAMN04488115_107300 [Bosea lathyri]